MRPFLPAKGTDIRDEDRTQREPKEGHWPHRQMADSSDVKQGRLYLGGLPIGLRHAVAIAQLEMFVKTARFISSKLRIAPRCFQAPGPITFPTSPSTYSLSRPLSVLCSGPV